jgi:hypothetical protein
MSRADSGPLPPAPEQYIYIYIYIPRRVPRRVTRRVPRRVPRWLRDRSHPRRLRGGGRPRPGASARHSSALRPHKYEQICVARAVGLGPWGSGRGARAVGLGPGGVGPSKGGRGWMGVDGVRGWRWRRGGCARDRPGRQIGCGRLG